jgi:hypothetical protein
MKKANEDFPIDVEHTPGSFDPETGIATLPIVRVSGLLTVGGDKRDGIRAAKDANRIFWLQREIYNGTLYESNIRFIYVRGDFADIRVATEIRNDWKQRAGSLGKVYGARAPIGKSNLFTSPRIYDKYGINWRSDPSNMILAHEIGHMLGLSHAPDLSGSIMSYDPIRALTGRDIFNLSEGYK